MSKQTINQAKSSRIIRGGLWSWKKTTPAIEL